jgi:hypothetical protein
MLQLKNLSPFAPALAVFPNQDAVDTVHVVVRATFALGARLALVDKPVPPSLADEYWGDPATSSLRYASELHVGKPATDVVLNGQAWAAGGRAVPEALALVSVAGRRKVIRVHGDRTWQRGGGFSRPEPFVSMPLVFERAFGGQHQVSEAGPVLAEERNPVGVGFLGKRSPGEMVGQKLPNLEDVDAGLKKLGDRPPPACFGFVAPSWLPRRAHAGTYDEAWMKGRAPFLPRDFDARFFSSAAPELTFDRFLAGGEPVELVGVSEDGPLRFELPRCRPRVEIKVAGATERPPVSLETVLIEPDERRVGITFRAQLPCDKKVLKVQEVRVEAEDPDSILPR